MILSLAFGCVTTGVVIYALTSIALGIKVSPIVYTSIMGVGLLVIILGATGVLSGINKRKRLSDG